MPEVRATAFELPNGLTVLAVEQPGTEATSVQVWCQTGSIHEGAWVGAGLTHLLEHMLFKGTARRTAVEISQAIHDEGGYLNAYTSFDRTVFWVDCPKPALRPSLEVLADMIFESSIRPDELQREMDVIRREFEMGYDDPDRMLSQLTFATAYQRHPCRYPVIGVREVFDRLDHAAVLDYYRSRYVPNNLFVVVAGDFEPETVREEVSRVFGSVPPGPLGSEVLPDEPRQQGRRTGVRVFDSEVSYFSLAFHVPPLFSPDMPALDVSSVILGGGASSVLYKLLREERGSVYGVGAFSYTPAFSGLLTVSGTCPEKSLDGLAEETLTAIHAWRRDGVRDEALAKAKRVIAVGAVEQLQTVRGVATDVGLNWLYTRNVDYSQRYLRKVQEVTVSDVAAVCDRYLQDENVSFTSLRSHVPARVLSKKAAARREPELVELGPGRRVVLIPDARLPLLHASAVFRGGVAGELPGQGGAARLHSQCVVRATHRRSPNDLAEEVEALGGSLSGDSGYNSFRVAISTLSLDAERLVDILCDVLAAPTFPPEVVERERESQLAALRAEEAQPQVVARNLLRHAAYGAHPYGKDVLGGRESLVELGGEALAATHRRSVTDGEGVLVCNGQFDRDRLLETLQRQMPMPAAPPLPPPAMPPLETLETRRIVHHDQRNQAIVAIGFLACSLFSPDRAALELLDEATGDSSSRLFIRIREQLGLAYSVGTSISLGLAPGLLNVYAATSPKTVDEVAALCHEEMSRLGEGGLTPEEFERAKTRLLAQYAFQKQSLDGYAHAVALNVLYGLGLRYHDERRAALQALDLRMVQEVCRKYLMQKPSVTVIVKP